MNGKKSHPGMYLPKGGGTYSNAVCPEGRRLEQHTVTKGTAVETGSAPVHSSLLGQVAVMKSLSVCGWEQRKDAVCPPGW